MGAFIEKYLLWFKWGAIALLAVGLFFFGRYVGDTRTELKYTNKENGVLTKKVQDQDTFIANYQALVKERDALQAQYSAAKAQNDQLTWEKQHANQSTTLELINTLRNPTDGLYAEDSNCGEAGSYPEVFVQFVSPTGTTSGRQLPTTDAGVHQK